MYAHIIIVSNEQQQILSHLVQWSQSCTFQHDSMLSRNQLGSPQRSNPFKKAGLAQTRFHDGDCMRRREPSNMIAGNIAPVRSGRCYSGSNDKLKKPTLGGPLIVPSGGQRWLGRAHVLFSVLTKFAWLR